MLMRPNYVKIVFCDLFANYKRQSNQIKIYIKITGLDCTRFCTNLIMMCEETICFIHLHAKQTGTIQLFSVSFQIQQIHVQVISNYKNHMQYLASLLAQNRCRRESMHVRTSA